MLVFISVAPADKWESMSADVAESLRLIRESGLDHELTAMGTLIEGSRRRCSI
ncbi:MAG: thiamine-binding protein [Deltaproteobacteria bacterium]|nr:thiamine-binding protein [Deltaproteobacteria bacterium]